MYARAMPWQKQYDEAEVLNRAMDAFWTRGYEATSIKDLVEATGIHRGSLYAAYEDKRALFIHALKHYDNEYRRDFLENVGRENKPRDAIVEVFRQVVQSAQAGKNRRGCLLVNAALELAPHDPEIGDFIKESLKAVETFFKERIEAAQQDGSISPATSAEKTAGALLGLLLGLRVLSRSCPDETTMNAIADQAEQLLQ